ncbi:response regulator transcription factor [Azotosporobacter soli]|uniref:response regulator transcription factor n=1 Tax=Azotosporobacter soli TaxID=3055040 RepID=UPI0031FED151
MTEAIRVVLADDHCLLRAGLRMLLEAKPGIAVVGEASDGREALRVIQETQAQVAVLDLAMPKMDGMQCLQEIKALGLETKVIVLTMYEDENYIRAVMKAGAMAFIQKSSVDTELFKAIQAVQEGRIYLSQRDTQALLGLLLTDGAPPDDGQDPYQALSMREREVLKLLAGGFSCSEVAEKLTLSVKTVETYKARIMEKLHFSHKSEMIRYAVKHHML